MQRGAGSLPEPQLEIPIESEDWDQDADPREQSNQNKAVDQRLMMIAVILSLVLHFALGRTLMGVSFSSPPLVIPDTVSIQLIPELLPALPQEEFDTPIIEESEAIEVAEQLEELPVDTLVEADTEDLAETQEALIEEELPIELIVEVEPEPETSEVTQDQPAPDQQVPLPSLDVIQTVVRQDFLEQQREDRNWASSCTNLQRQSGVLGCVSQDKPDLAGIEQSPESRAIYQFHNPVVERSRTERTISTLSANSALVAANLANAEIPEGLGEFILSELESTITFYSPASNGVKDNMDQMINNSEAALLYRSLFDPGIRHQIQENQRRRYYSRQDRQRMAECGGLGIFVLAITELEKFADCTTREGNLLFRLAPLLL